MIVVMMADTSSTDVTKLQQAMQLQQETLKLRKRVLPADHPRIATSMCDVGSAYSNLGMHHEALQMQQETLELMKRVLPADHPDITTSMRNLAATYHTLGIQQKALQLQQETGLDQQAGNRRTRRCSADVPLSWDATDSRRRSAT